MKIEIPLKPPSINHAHYGEHKKTSAVRQFEKDMCKVVPFFDGEVSDSEYFVKYVFYVKNYKMSDTANLEKILTDMLVKLGYLKDDRYIKAMYLEKIKVDDVLNEHVECDIVLYKDRSNVL